MCGAFDEKGGNMRISRSQEYDETDHERSDEEEPEEKRYVDLTDIRDNDILCGRGNGVAMHPGNQIFRRLIKMHQMAYQAAPREHKAPIVFAVARAIDSLNPPGRFLEASVNGKCPVLTRDKVLEKTAQALREKPNRRSRAKEAKKEVDRLLRVEAMSRLGVLRKEAMNRVLLEEFQGKTSSLGLPIRGSSGYLPALPVLLPPPPPPIVEPPVVAPTLYSISQAASHHRRIMNLTTSALRRSIQANKPVVQPAALAKPKLFDTQQPQPVVASLRTGLGMKRTLGDSPVGNFKRPRIVVDDVEGQFDDAPESSILSSSLGVLRARVQQRDQAFPLRRT